ncbi:MAG: hypothetical protein AAGD38_11475 [Acidobacteriota bacterium]
MKQERLNTRLEAMMGKLVSLTDYGLESEEVRGRELRRIRVDFDEARMVSLHRQVNQAQVAASVAILVFGFLIGLLFWEITPVVLPIFVGIGAYGLITALQTFVITVASPRTQVVIRLPDHNKARELYGRLGRLMAEAQRRLADARTDLPPAPPSGTAIH